MSLICTRMSSICHSYVVLPWTRRWRWFNAQKTEKSVWLVKRFEEIKKLFQWRNWLLHHVKVIFILFLKEHISSEIIHSAIVVDDDEVGIAIINFAKQSVEQIEFIHEELLSEVPSAMTKKRRSNTVKKIIKMQMDSSSLLLPPNSTKPIDESCDNKIINLSILQNNFHLPQNV